MDSRTRIDLDLMSFSNNLPDCDVITFSFLATFHEPHILLLSIADINASSSWHLGSFSDVLPTKAHNNG